LACLKHADENVEHKSEDLKEVLMMPFILRGCRYGYMNMNANRKGKKMSKFHGVQVCKLTFLKVDENGDSIDDKEYEYTGDHSSFCEGIDEDYLEEVKEAAQ
jgi:hypothetical protein